MKKQPWVTNWKHCLTVSLWASVLTLAVVPSQSAAEGGRASAHHENTGNGKTKKDDTQTTETAPSLEDDAALSGD